MSPIRRPGAPILAHSLALTALVVSFVTQSFGQNVLYWTERTGMAVRSLNLENGVTEPIARGVGMLEVGDIEVDELSGDLFWAENGPLSPRIGRASVDGSKVEFLVSPGWGESRCRRVFDVVAVDAVNGFVFWMAGDVSWKGGQRQNYGIVCRSPIDFSQTNWEEVEIVRALGAFNGIAVHPAEGKIYWSASEAGRIQRADLDGSNVEDVLTSGFQQPGQLGRLAIDRVNNHLYYVDGSWIGRSNLDGSGAGALVQAYDPVAQSNNSVDIGVDPKASLLCWSHRSGNDSASIYCSDLDGQNVVAAQSNLGFITGITLDSRLAKLYWADSGEMLLHRSAYDGTNAERVFDPVAKPIDIAVDPVDKKLYWMDAERWQAFRSDLNGERLELLSWTGPYPSGLDLDLQHRKLYEGIYWDGDWKAVSQIMRCDLDGSIEESIVGLYNGIGDLKVDPVNRRVYFMSKGRSTSIESVGFDGTGRTSLVGGLQQPGYFALDNDAAQLYWTDTGARQIKRVDLDGTGLTELVGGLPAPKGLALDPYRSYLYWTDEDDGAIYRARTDGSEMEQILDIGAVEPAGLDVLASPIVVSPQSPAADETNVLTTTALRWRPSYGAQRYDMQVSSTSDFASLVHTYNTPAASAEFVAPVAEHTYYWRVRGMALGKRGPWMSVRGFTVGNSGPLAVQVVRPANDAIGVPVDAVFEWTVASSAEAYHLQVSTTSDFSSTAVDERALAETVYHASALLPETVYFWRIAGVDEEGRKTFTRTHRFTTSIVAPGQVALLSPASGQTGVSPLTSFSWNATDRAETYRFQLSEDQSFTRIVVDESDMPGTSWSNSLPLAYDAEFFWRVQASNEGGVGVWSETWRFRVAVGTSMEDNGLPTAFSLHAPYPNPVRSTTTIMYDLPEPCDVDIIIFDGLGRRIEELTSQSKGPGRHKVDWHPGDTAPGLYFVLLRAGSHQSLRTLVSR